MLLFSSSNSSVSDRILRKGDAHFKGETDYESFREGNLVKYTVGASSNYNEIYRLRKSLQEKFPELSSSLSKMDKSMM